MNMKTRTYKFNEILKELRVEKKLSQETLAKEVGFSQSAIAKWEAGLQIPNIEVLAVFVEYFGVTADYMLGFED